VSLSRFRTHLFRNLIGGEIIAGVSRLPRCVIDVDKVGGGGSMLLCLYIHQKVSHLSSFVVLFSLLTLFLGHTPILLDICNDIVVR